MSDPSAITVPIRRFPGGEGMPLPAYATPGSAGLDLSAAVDRPLRIDPGGRALVPTGFGIAIPEGYEGQVRPRSGIAVRQGLTLLNAPGTVDADYRGEVMIVVANLGDAPVVINRGDRIAQLVIAPVARAALRESADLPPTARGEGGFGHSGL